MKEVSFRHKHLHEARIPMKHPKKEILLGQGSADSCISLSTRQHLRHRAEGKQERKMSSLPLAYDQEI